MSIPTTLGGALEAIRMQSKGDTEEQGSLLCLLTRAMAHDLGCERTQVLGHNKSTPLGAEALACVACHRLEVPDHTKLRGVVATGLLAEVPEGLGEVDVTILVESCDPAREQAIRHDRLDLPVGLVTGSRIEVDVVVVNGVFFGSNMTIC